MLKSFFHTGFVVKDLEKTLDFYTNVMELRVAGRMERTGGFASQLLGFRDAHIKGAFLELGEGHQLELSSTSVLPAAPAALTATPWARPIWLSSWKTSTIFTLTSLRRACALTVSRLLFTMKVASYCAKPSMPRTRTATG